MPDITGSPEPSSAREYNTTGRPEIDGQVRDLVQAWGGGKNPALIEEMIGIALHMADPDISPADLKLFNRSLKELRYAAKVFAPYHATRKIAIFGSARTPSTADDYVAAVDFARKMAAENFMIITGGGDGIMGAANEGAGREHSFGLNIRLPFEQKANRFIDGDSKLVNFNYFFTRKLNFLKETHALACFPGGFGTMDETFECLTLMQTGKARLLPVVFINHPGSHFWETLVDFMKNHLLKSGLISAEDFDLFSVTENVDEAVAEIVRFYRNYHSSRWVGDRLVLRLQRSLSASALRSLEKDFADLLQGGPMEQRGALSEEGNEPALADLPRLVFAPNRRMFGRLRRLIDAVNAADAV